MTQIRKSGIIVIIFTVGALVYFGFQRYQNHHANNVQIQAKSCLSKGSKCNPSSAPYCCTGKNSCASVFSPKGGSGYACA